MPDPQSVKVWDQLKEFIVVLPKVLVIRNYEDRLRIVKDIHVNTGDEARHHRRDKMLELVGQQYYWKGQRRDICECVSNTFTHASLRNM